MSTADRLVNENSSAMEPRARHSIAVWLLILCGMIFLMVVLGGVTRLQHAGLSIVHWKPISGILPPLNAVQWQAEFEAYQKFPEYQFCRMCRRRRRIIRVWLLERWASRTQPILRA